MAFGHGAFKLAKSQTIDLDQENSGLVRSGT